MTAAPVGFTDEEIAGLCFDENGLVAAIVQDATTRDVLMLGWMDAEAVRRTLTSGRTWFWSRSRRNTGARAKRQAIANGYVPPPTTATAMPS